MSSSFQLSVAQNNPLQGWHILWMLKSTKESPSPGYTCTRSPPLAWVRAVWKLPACTRNSLRPTSLEWAFMGRQAEYLPCFLRDELQKGRIHAFFLGVSYRFSSNFLGHSSHSGEPPARALAHNVIPRTVILQLSLSLHMPWKGRETAVWSLPSSLMTMKDRFFIHLFCHHSHGRLGGKQPESKSYLWPGGFLLATPYYCEVRVFVIDHTILLWSKGLCALRRAEEAGKISRAGTETSSSL